ncbi:MAG: glycosyltransferase [Lactobacillaceae bacterium]|jgi:glycosyltransferase involved in cell wall biosynthesis|nr:glycosyltransferase [Lactobacillaceae bacterium]
MRVLIINTMPFYRNGVTQHILNYFAALKDQIQLDVVGNSMAAPDVAAQITAPAKLTILPNRKRHMVAYVKQLQTLVAAGDYDLIHIHGNSALMLLELLALHRFPAERIIVHNHAILSNYPLLNKVLHKPFLHYVHNAFSSSEAGGKWLYREIPFTIIPNGIDLAKNTYSPEWRATKRAELGLTDEFVLLSIAVATQQKNKAFLLDIFAALHAKLPHSRLIMIGDGPLQTELKEQAKTLNIDEHISWIIETDTPEQFYSVADAFVFPSLYESPGMVAIEAQVSHLPVLASQAVPQVTHLSDQISYLPLTAIQPWVEQLIKINAQVTNRTLLPDKRLQAFDIRVNAQNLVNLYSTIIK